MARGAPFCVFLSFTHIGSRLLFASSSWMAPSWRGHFLQRTRFDQSTPSLEVVSARMCSLLNSSSVLSDISVLLPMLISNVDQPPRCDLKVSDPSVRDLSLAELQLAPSSVLLLRFEDDQLNRVSFCLSPAEKHL
jgi:tether containing UBX domain for GLUT4